MVRKRVRRNCCVRARGGVCFRAQRLNEKSTTTTPTTETTLTTSLWFVVFCGLGLEVVVVAAVVCRSIFIFQTQDVGVQFVG